MTASSTTAKSPTAVSRERILGGITAILEAYPGPALWVDHAGTILNSSPVGRLLADSPDRENQGWWRALYEWLSAGESSHHLSEVVSAEGEVLIGWTATALPDGSVLLCGTDETGDENLKRALIDSRQRFRDLVDLAADFAWETDKDGRFIYVSPQGALGYAPEQLNGRNVGILMRDDDQSVRSPFETKRALSRSEHWLVKKDGSDAYALFWVRPLYDDDGTWRGARGLVREITEDYRREMQLARAETREAVIAHIVGAMRDGVEPDRILNNVIRSTGLALLSNVSGIYQFDRSGRLELAAQYNQAWDGEDAVPMVLDPVLDPALLPHDDAAQSPRLILTKDGSTMVLALFYRQELNGALVIKRAEDGDAWTEDDLSLAQAVGAQIGIALAQCGFIEQLRVHAEVDALTGLFNRRKLMESLAALTAAQPGALLYIDVNNFKPVNDLLGHAAGDRLLQALADRMRAHLRGGMVAGRLGGDEFLIWQPNTDPDALAAVCDDLIAFGDGLDDYAAREDLPVGLSIGVVLSDPAQDHGAEDLVALADRAMYRAKRAAKRDRRPGAWVLDPPPS